MDTDALRWFQQVADGVTVTEVSELERTTQSGVSRALARLEAEIGTPLLRRSGRTLRMTHAGAVFKHHVDAMMHQLDDGLAAVSQVVDPATGTVTLAYQPSLGTWLVPHLLSSFRIAHPDVRFDLKAKRDELTPLVRHRTEVDLELSTLRPADTTVEWTWLTREPLKLAVPSGHNLAATSHIRLADAAEEMFVTIVATSVLHRQSATLCREAGFEPTVAFEGHDLATVHGFVAAGLGVAIVPAMRGGPAEATLGAVRLLDITDVYAYREIGLAWAAGRRLLPAAELFRIHVLEKRTIRSTDASPGCQ
jgi:DNA-binding transcriptional LysR family regulator